MEGPAGKVKTTIEVQEERKSDEQRLQRKRNYNKGKKKKKNPGRQKIDNGRDSKGKLEQSSKGEEGFDEKIRPPAKTVSHCTETLGVLGREGIRKRGGSQEDLD